MVAQQTYNVCCAAGKRNSALLVACGFAGVKDLCQDVFYTSIRLAEDGGLFLLLLECKHCTSLSQYVMKYKH